MEQTTKQKFHFAWIVLIGCAIVKGVGGAVFYNTPSLMFLSMAETFGTGITEIALYNTISSVLAAISATAIAKFMAKPNVSTKWVLFVGMALFGVSYTLFGFSTNVYMIYAVTIGYSIGSIMAWQQAIPILITNWFEKSRGLALGLVTCAGGVFGLMVQPVAANILTTQTWQNTFKLLGTSATAIILIAIVLLVRWKPKNGLAYGAGEVPAQVAETNAAEVVLRGIPAKKAIRMPALWLYLACLFFLCYFMVFYFQAPTYSASLGYTTAQIGTIMASYEAGFAIGAVALGVLCDKIGAKNLMKVIFACMVACAALFLLGVISIAPLMGALFINGAINGGAMVIMPMIVSENFGLKDFTRIFGGYVVTVMYATGIVSTPTQAIVYDLFGSYTPMIILILAMGVIGLILSFIFTNMTKKIQDHWE